MLHPRARTMLLLAVPALIIGVASSLVLIVVMKVAAVLQTILWTALPVKLGISSDSPGWIMVMLTLTGIAVGLVIRYSPGHAGPDPALEPLIGATRRFPEIKKGAQLSAFFDVIPLPAQEVVPAAGCGCSLPRAAARCHRRTVHPEYTPAARSGLCPGHLFSPA